MKMIERERQLTGEPFTSYRNAFVTAAMAARDPFHTKADKAIKEWREKWEKSLTPEQESIWDAMRHARNDEAHIGRKSRPAKSRRPAEKAGFKLSVDQEEINVGIGSPYYSNRSVRGGGYMSPAILLARGINTNVFAYRDTHSYEIDGQKRNVTAFCGEYLALLQCMVTQYEADHP